MIHYDLEGDTLFFEIYNLGGIDVTNVHGKNR
ncbi:MAG: hypothetical protein UW96_C0020G0002 [Candidatus Collierbacteria bacterium GW2011_GWA1_45_15]|jgi:hypothetical protein|nr:MAG: hypothetical protein UW96_C0020G0002 [Candidatus Collierbacteria bacterium GW2011_GWA1_45_15]